MDSVAPQITTLYLAATVPLIDPQFRSCLVIKQAEYIWLDGALPTKNVRSKTRIIQLANDREVTLADFPVWNYDDSSTNQSPGGDSDLTDIDIIRWEKYQLNMLDIWALAHSRYTRELLSADQWMTWDRYFTHMFSNESEAISKARWEGLGYGFDAEFWDHVGAVLFGEARNER